MYFNIGQDVVVPTDEIIGIFNINNNSSSNITRDFLRRSHADGRVINASEKAPCAFALISKRGGKDARIYLSRYTAPVFLKRGEYYFNTGTDAL